MFIDMTLSDAFFEAYIYIYIYIYIYVHVTCTTVVFMRVLKCAGERVLCAHAPARCILVDKTGAFEPRA